tara:strand:- start:22292 stop:23476 length:1185 start_codon:yes stop_codon:yes gene_type:complete
MDNSFPYSRQLIKRDDINEVVKVLKSDYLTQGPILKKLELNFKKKVKSRYCLAVSSATAGLHLSCLSLDLKKGDYLWTVPNSFVASANCGLYCGAKIDFVDINEFTFNIDINLLKKKLDKAKKKNKIPKVLVVVHMAGSPADVIQINKLGKKYNFKIIEDASHAIGASYNKNFKVGSCKWSDITVFSLHPVKIITSGEGGIITTNSKEIFNKIKSLRTHGILRDKNLLRKKNYGFWYYEQKYLGFNYRLSDIHAALGNSQLKKISKFVRKRNEIANYYKKNIKEKNILFQKLLKETYSSYHLFIIQFKKIKDEKIYNELFEDFRKKKIMVNLHYLPIHLQPNYMKNGFKKGQFKVSENYAKKSLSIPIYPQLKKKELNYIIKIIKLLAKKYDLL